MTRQLSLRVAPGCATCPAQTLGDEGNTELGCSPDLGAPERSQRILYAQSRDFLARVAEVDGFHFNIPARSQEDLKLPPYIPRIRRWMRVSDLSAVSAVAVPLSQVIALVHRGVGRDCSLRDFLRLSDEQLVVVSGFENDPFLERYWQLPNRLELLEAIRTIGPDLAIAWNYSIWHVDLSGRPYPRAQHLYNLKRSLVIFAELQDLDIPAMPHVYWGLRSDLDRWADWFAKNPGVSQLAIDLQTVFSDDDWHRLLEDARYLHDRVPRGTVCFFSGVCETSRVLDLKKLWPESVLSNFAAFFAATMPRKNLYGLGEPGNRSPQQAFNETAAQYSFLMTDPRSMAGLAWSSIREDRWRDNGFLATQPVPRGPVGKVRQLPLFSDELQLAGIVA